MCLGKYGRVVHCNYEATIETHANGTSSSSSCREESAVTVNLEKLAECGRENKGWYVNTVNVSGSQWQAVRSVECNLMTGAEHDECSECSRLPQNSSLRNAVNRVLRDAARGPNAKPKRKTMTREEMQRAIQTASTICKKKDKKIEALRTSLTRARQQSKTYVRDCLASGDLRGVVSALQHMGRKANENTATEKAGTCPVKTATAVATDILVAVCRKLEGKSNKGNRLSKWTKALLSTVRHQNGEIGMNLFTRNLLVGSDRTARRAVDRPSVPFMARLTDTDFEYLALVYGRAKAAHGITDTFPVEIAEDETAVQAKAEWDPPSNEVVGKCGALCASKCETIAKCRKVMRCTEPHACVPTGDFSHVIQDGDPDAFDKLQKWHEESRTGTQARLMVVNPMDTRLPQLPILFVPTCLTFTADVYVAQQWRLVRQLYDRHLLPVLGPLVSEGASDGASTRRALHVRHAMGTLAAGLVRFTLDAPGFMYHGTASVNEDGRLTAITIRKDQDYIHAAKKLINPTDINSRILQIGTYMISLSMLETVQRHCHQDEHGMRATDTERSGFDSMDVPSVWRLLSLKVATCLVRCIDGFAPNALNKFAGCAPQTQLRGMQAYLAVVRRYAEIFMSRKLKHVERVKSAGMVVTFLQLWRLWLQQTAKKDLKVHYLSSESVTDATLSCHFAVLWLKMFREMYPNREPLLYRTGTDVCESWFSLLGGFIQNKRVYSVLEGLQTIRTKMTSELTYASGIARPQHKKRVTGEWDELPDDDERNGSQFNYPSDEDMARAWVDGADEARSMCEDLGMKPATQRMPGWWTSPHDHVPTPGNGARGEIGDGEEEIVARELEDGEEEPNEGNPDTSGTDDDDDDAMDEAVQALDAAASLVSDAHAEAEESHPHQRAKIIATLTVPNVGVVHKQKVLMWLNGAVRALSADRNKRVQQTMVAALNQNAQLHQLSEHDWWVGAGDNVAVLFEEGRTKKFYIGRVISMRRLKTGRGGSVQYRRNVLIHEDRGDLEGLQLYLHWYSPCEAPVGQPQLMYEYNHIDPNPVDIATVICPCALVYDISNDTYTMQAATYSVYLPLSPPHPFPRRLYVTVVLAVQMCVCVCFCPCR